MADWKGIKTWSPNQPYNYTEFDRVYENMQYINERLVARGDVAADIRKPDTSLGYYTEYDEAFANIVDGNLKAMQFAIERAQIHFDDYEEVKTWIFGIVDVLTNYDFNRWERPLGKIVELLDKDLDHHMRYAGELWAFDRNGGI